MNTATFVGRAYPTQPPAGHGRRAAEPVTIGFNPAFLGEVTKVITDEELASRVSGPSRPALFTGADGRIYLVMPVRIA